MHLIWKRPDGFHGASPSDYTVVELGGHSRLWLHKTDHDQYPFRIAGGWEEKEATKRLNNLINLLPQSKEELLNFLNYTYDHTMRDDRKKFIEDLYHWLGELAEHVKGDTWEAEILTEALRLTQNRINEVRHEFLQKTPAASSTST